MKGAELLETYPKAAAAIKEFYYGKMIDSLQEENDIPEEFKDMIKAQQFDSEYVATFIDTNPRFLFDIFDENGIYINVTAFRNGLFLYSIISDVKEEVGSTETSNTRKEAEKLAIEQAFEILNEKL
jgi:hypothetical protein